ncbi:MAG: DUF362 domain-containing protein [Anaerolineaceae bacterium]
MQNISRRKFLKDASLGLGGLILASLTGCKTATPQPFSPTQNILTKIISTESSTVPPVPETTSTSEPTLPTKLPDLAVSRNGEPEIMVRQVIEALGGMNQFVPFGANVIIKPNICVAYHTYEYAATTNPWVVGALVKLCFEAGAASVKVMDNPFGGTAEEAYKISGIADMVNAAGGEMIFMVNRKFIHTSIPNAIKLKEVSVYEDILKTDVLINVPIAKTHGLATLTLGMKNLMGTILKRESLHAQLGDNLADLAGFLRPALTVIDGIRVLMANGPTGGSLSDVKQMNTIIASRDIVAADSYAASTLFGMDPLSLSYITSGTSAGLGSADIHQLQIEEISNL